MGRDLLLVLPRHVVEIGVQPSDQSKLFKTRYALTEGFLLLQTGYILLELLWRS